MRGIPPSVTQAEFQSKKAHIYTRGTSKDEVTEGDPKCTNLFEYSMYDTTPVHYIIMVSEELKWVSCYNSRWYSHFPFYVLRIYVHLY